MIKSCWSSTGLGSFDRHKSFLSSAARQAGFYSLVCGLDRVYSQTELDHTGSYNIHLSNELKINILLI